MRRYNFGVVISSDGQRPVATHLPFVIEERGTDIFIVTHFSRTNPQWKTFDGQELLVIFSEPHAYISPSLYEQQQNVPTWNYVAVHAYGKAHFLNTPEEQVAVLEKMMAAFEQEYLDQWRSLNPAYKENLQKGIVAFEIKVEELQGKAKLSQNKTANERVNIIRHLEDTDDTMKAELAKLMKDI